jgi:2-polyprenyl-6-methoxyphenol hydroxylase-like FAD-dependent oxidoreductase
VSEDLWDLVVVGAGPAGSCAALGALKASPGLRVLLLDRADFPRDKSCGDGIAPHVLDVLATVGAADAVAGWTPLRHLELARGDTSVCGPMRREVYVVPREVFDARLVEHAVAAGAVLQKRRVRRVEVRDDRVVLDADLAARVVVGADGVHSVLRPHVVGEVRGRYSGTVGYRGLVPAATLPSLPDPTPLQFWAGPGRHLLHYSIDGGRTINFLAVVRVPEWTNAEWMEPCPVTDAVDAFAGWHPAVTEMVGATDVGTRWALHDLEPLERWHTDRAVLMGDAAHAMVPHQGQGANQTIEDAIVLADCLADVRATTDLASALRRYAERRRKRTARVQRWSRRVADLMHLPDGPEIAPRDAVLAGLYSELAWSHS